MWRLLKRTSVREDDDAPFGTRSSLMNKLSGIGAVSDSTTIFICLSALNLLRVPKRLKLMGKKHSLLRGSHEEVLRCDGFGKSGVPRYALTDVKPIKSLRIRVAPDAIPAIP